MKPILFLFALAFTSCATTSGTATSAVAGNLARIRGDAKQIVALGNDIQSDAKVIRRILNP